MFCENSSRGTDADTRPAVSTSVPQLLTAWLPDCSTYRGRALSERPLLIAAAVAGPQLGQRPVGGAPTAHVQAEPRLHTGDRAVGVECPLLVRLAVAGPDLHLGARRGLVVVGVQAQLRTPAVDRQLVRRGVRPDLVDPAVAVPDLRPRSQGRGRVRHVEALARADRVDLARGVRAGAAAAADAVHDRAVRGNGGADGAGRRGR